MPMSIPFRGDAKVKRFRTTQWSAATLAVFGLLIPMGLNHAAPQPVVQPLSNTVSAPTAKRPTAMEAIASQGVVRGVWLDGSGKAQANRTIHVAGPSGVTRVVTDGSGRFSFAAKPGSYQLATSEGFRSLRVWNKQLAPPSARDRLLVADQDLVRGQRPLSDVLFADPIMIGLILAAAVAIPVIVSARKKNS